MRYVSTRGRAGPIGFREAVTSGLAPDGGLYMPERWPRFPAASLAAMENMSLAEVAAASLAAFFDKGDDVPDRDFLAAAMSEAFASFPDPDAAPLRPIGDGRWLLELFHGPTLAFKDVAMQALARLYPWALAGADRKKTLIVATSGDTGGAAVAAFADAPGVDLFVLHPRGRISDVQRRIMTTVRAGNIRNVAIEGSFDDCQRIVKALFIDPETTRRVDLGGVNSINWVRLAVQTSYYLLAGARLGAPASWVVPTGNFGDVFAGFVAARMGLPVRRLIVATNENDIVHKAISTGHYAPAGVRATTSPSMDIAVASNFERLLFEAMGRDADRLSALMDNFGASGEMMIPDDVRTAIAARFGSARVGEAEVANRISDMRDEFGILVDPHTAVGLAAAGKTCEASAEAPVVTLATAHPAKFPDAVAAASGVVPALPSRYADLFGLEERMETLPSDVGAVRAALLEGVRA